MAIPGVFLSPEWYVVRMDARFRKLDVAARRAVAEDRPGARIEVLIRVDGSSERLTDALRATGLEIHSVAGRVASGIIDAGQLTELAALPFVRRVETSRALFPEVDSD